MSKETKGVEKNKTASVAIFCLLCLVLVQRGILGAPMWGESFELKQPDGATAQVMIWGDEFYQVVESLDGYTLVRDPASGVICYATVSADDQELVSTGTKMLPAAPAGLGINKHLRIAQSSVQEKVSAARVRFREGELLVGGLPGVPEPAAPSTGNVRALCLIIDFPDAAGTISPSEIDDYCNQVGYSGYGNNGSVRDYFYDVSDGNLVYTNYVPSQYYTAIHNKRYYDNPAESMGPKARELIIEALNDLDSRGFDFSQYDSNGDGYVDGVNAFYAGNCGSGWSKGLWPHSWTVSFSADGVSTFKYQVTDMRSSLSLGTFCHENGHMICYWPDLYDYDYDSAGVGRFCLMAYGGAGSNPVEPCAYLKAAAGWSSVSTAAGIHTLTAGVNSCFMFPHPSWSGEYYLVENRQATGRDSSLPDSGIAIWYVDEYGSNNNQQMLSWSHYECTLVQADGDWYLENYRNYGDSTDLWAAPGYTTCGPSTNPNTSWWSGDASDLLITNISAPGPSMTFTVGGEPYALSVQSTPDTGAAITGTYPGTTNYTASVSAATAVTVTAPWEHAGKFFLRWKDSGGTTLTYHGAYSFTMNADATVIAEYGDVTEFYINDATPEPPVFAGDGRIQYYLQIAEFEVYAAGTEVVKLSWTATGDGGYMGTAASYEARYSTQEITTQEIWDAATGVTGEPSPEIAATSQSMTISTSALPADARVYFAIRTTNHAGIESDLSNSPYVDTSGCGAPRRLASRQMLSGDANGDCRVNIIDLIFIRGRLGQDVHTADNWKADVNQDGLINVLDLVPVRDHIGSSCE